MAIIREIVEEDFFASLVPEFFGLIITVLILDFLYDIRSSLELKTQLLIEIASSDNGTAIRAAKLMEVKGWLHDGTMEHGDLMNADLSKLAIKPKAKFDGVNLTKAKLHHVEITDSDFNKCIANTSLDMKGVDFKHSKLFRNRFNNSHLIGADFRKTKLHRVSFKDCNLLGAQFDFAECLGTDFEGANVLVEQLIFCNSLIWATMQDGEIYDGRFNLNEDMRLIKAKLYNPNSEIHIAEYYGVSIEKYTAGQIWHKEYFDEFLSENRDYHLKWVSGELQ